MRADMNADVILKALEVVIDPELRRSIVELEMVRSIDISENGVVDVTVSLTTAGCPIRGHFQTSVAEAVSALEGVTHVNVYFDVLSDSEKSALQQKLGRGSLPAGSLPQVSHVVWRGPMLHKALGQFLQDVEWGVLDYLLIDLPPGTGDVSMTLAQMLPQAQFVIVTTPQATAQKVARRSAEMANKVSLEICGVIENMSGFTTPSVERYAIFGEGGGKELADELDVPLLGSVPLTMPLREHADSGVPLVIEDPDDPASQAIHQVARGLIAMAPLDLPVLPLVEVAPPAPAPAESPRPVGMSLPMA